MSDDLVPPPNVPAEPVAAAPAEPPPAPPDPDEAQAIEVQGGKMVPLPALKAAREETRTWKEKAAKVEALEAEAAALRPYKQFMDQHPGLLQQPAQPAAPPDPKADPELVELARSLDY